MAVNEMPPRTTPNPPTEQITGTAQQIADKIKELVHEGNIRAVRVKRDGRNVVEIPLTVAVIGTALAPQLMVLGVIAALVAQCSIEVVRTDAGIHA